MDILLYHLCSSVYLDRGRAAVEAAAAAAGSPSVGYRCVSVFVDLNFAMAMSATEIHTRLV